MSREQLSKLAETLQGIPVWGCLPGSQGRNAGIQYGDVVLSVNGQRTSDAGAYLAARKLRSDGVTLVVFRNGTTQTLQLRFETEGAADEQRLRDVAQSLVESRLLPSDPPPSSASDARHN
ncbi:MAG: hypothetical protein RL033_3095 [Pseudomonadota bacterium]